MSGNIDFDSGTGSTFANALRIAITIIFFFISGITTFLFFAQNYTFWETPPLDWVWAATAIAGTYGVAMTDLAGVVWLFLLLKGSDNNEERIISSIGTGVGVLGGAITSMGFMLTNSSLLPTMPPQFSPLIGVSLGVILAFNTILAVIFSYFNASGAQDRHFSSMRRRALSQINKLATEQFNAALPAIAEKMANKQVTEMHQAIGLEPPNKNGSRKPATTMPRPQPRQPRQANPSSGMPRPSSGTRPAVPVMTGSNGPTIPAVREDETNRPR